MDNNPSGDQMNTAHYIDTYATHGSKRRQKENESMTKYSDTESTTTPTEILKQHKDYLCSRQISKIKNEYMNWRYEQL